jgi:hypothetical protein
MASAESFQLATVCRERVAQVRRRPNATDCLLVSGTKLTLSPFLAAHITAADDISFPVLASSLTAATELYITRNSVSGPTRDLYQAPIRYVTQPQKDKRDEFFVAAEVQQGNLGFSSVLIPCEALRQYFYRQQKEPATDRRTLYQILRISSSASPAELRVAFKLRQLELQQEHAPHGEHVLLERAFNIVATPELRACYDAVLSDPEAPALFPCGGFGSLLTSGERSHDGKTFFAHRILAFLPERRQHRFRAPLRRLVFYDDRALYNDVRRKLELWVDHAVLHKVWDASWNQWKHLLETKMDVSATFVGSGKYRHRRGEWERVTWETALPSRLEVRLPADFEQHIDAAKRTYHRFGPFSAAVDKIRQRIEHEAMEKADLEKMLSALNVPRDFDVAQISWRPDYDPFFYRQLSRRARRIYLFRDEYIFDLQRAVVIETPQLGNATYVFSKPRSITSFLVHYTRISKDDIRRNRENAAERLGFLSRVIHGNNPKHWMSDIRRHIGESTDYLAAAAGDY